MALSAVELSDAKMRSNHSFLADSETGLMLLEFSTSSKWFVALGISRWYEEPFVTFRKRKEGPSKPVNMLGKPPF